MSDALSAISSWINETFRFLVPWSQKVHGIFDGVFMPWARVAAVGLFVAAMVWVFTLRKEYVNLDAPSKHWTHDLRLWTVVCMLPHVLVYLWL